MSRVSDPKVFTKVEFTSEMKCFTEKDKSAVYDALKNSKELITPVLREQQDGRFLDGDKETTAHLESDFFNILMLRKNWIKPDCPFNVLRITQNLKAKDIISTAGAFDSLWTAFERTLYDAYAVVGFKLSPYIYFDPYESLSLYFASLKIMVSSTFLGAFPVDQDRIDLIADFDQLNQAPDGQLRIPFSPMVASSLTTSIFLLIYVISRAGAILRTRVIANSSSVLTAFDTDKAVFTTIGVTLSFVIIALYGSLFLIEILWRAVFA